MGELALDNIRVEPLLVQGGGGQCPEPVWCSDPLVPHPPHGIAQGILTYGVGQLALTRKQQLAMAGQSAQLSEHGQRLPGERDKVFGAHLHPLGGDAPLGPLDVKLGPAGKTHLTRTGHGQHQQVKGKAGCRVQRLGFKAAEELRQLRTGQGGPVLLLGGLECSFQVLGWVVAGAPGLDGVAHDRTDPLQHPPRRFGGTALLHLAQGIQHHGCRQLGHRHQP
ncbi:hypothetical protein D3C84_638110 [compost metagenome]